MNHDPELVEKVSQVLDSEYLELGAHRYGSPDSTKSHFRDQATAALDVIVPAVREQERKRLIDTIRRETWNVPQPVWDAVKSKMEDFDLYIQEDEEDDDTYSFFITHAAVTAVLGLLRASKEQPAVHDWGFEEMQEQPND